MARLGAVIGTCGEEGNMDWVTRGLGLLTLAFILATAVGYYAKGASSMAKVQMTPRAQASPGAAAR
jgi:hypothetical protein